MVSKYWVCCEEKLTSHLFLFIDMLCVEVCPQTVPKTTDIVVMGRPLQFSTIYTEQHFVHF